MQGKGSDSCKIKMSTCVKCGTKLEEEKDDDDDNEDEQIGCLTNISMSF